MRRITAYQTNLAHSRKTTGSSDNFSLVSDQSVHPAEDALAGFSPEKDQIDKVLYDGIVDDDE